MSKKVFSDEEIKILSLNPNIKKVSKKSITYTDEFREKFIREYDGSKSIVEFFEENGISIDIIGRKRAFDVCRLWRIKFDLNGKLGIVDSRKLNSGRKKELSKEETIENLKLENKLLKAENELLKKVQIAERRVMKKK